MHYSIVTIIALFLVTTAYSRSIYLNGHDVSSIRGQNLKKVNIKIDENGDVFIDAPHYQVNEERSYTPLSEYRPAANAPEHRAPAPLLDTALSIPGEQPTDNKNEGQDRTINKPATTIDSSKSGDSKKLQEKPGQNVKESG